jgi:hypothetical protein
MNHNIHDAPDDTPGSTIDKLAYVVGAIIAQRRADERRARHLASFGH